tara:strand:+ start:37 stop:786 length:750 start_codon:yes stop_codon:yes gene_type:complete
MAITNATTLADYASGIGTQSGTFEIDATNKRIGITSESPTSNLDVGHIIKMDGTAGVATFQTVSVAGTITYEDVTNVDSVGIVTAGGGVRIAGGGIQAVGFYTGLNASGVATFANTVLANGWVSCGDTIALGDAKGIYFGADEDLSIYHDGTHSYIKDAGTGELKVHTDFFIIQNAAANETQLSCSEDGAVKLYYDNSLKLETSTAGTVVTGISTADDFTIGVGGTSVHTALGTKASTGKAIAMAMVFG